MKKPAKVTSSPREAWDPPRAVSYQGARRHHAPAVFTAPASPRHTLREPFCDEQNDARTPAHTRSDSARASLRTRVASGGWDYGCLFSSLTYSYVPVFLYETSIC